jgi:hypothetical protein
MVKSLGVPAMQIGTVGGNRFVLEAEGNGRTAGCTINVDLDTLYDRWANSLKRTLEAQS